MGSSCCCDNNFPQQALTAMLKRGLEGCGLPGLKEGQSLKINAIALFSERFNTLKTTDYEIIIQKKNYQDEESSYIRLICLPLNQVNNKGLIIYEDAFYHGEILNNNAESNNGALHFTRKGQSECQYVVKGSWSKDKLEKGCLVKIEKNRQQRLLDIKRIGDNKAFIQFQAGEIRSYEGTVNWNKLDFKQFLTGQGKIQFRNNSIYIGGIRNGLMNTEATNQRATFKTPGETQIFQGFYKNGLRNGKGTSIVKKQSMRYSYTVQWRNGLPDLESFQYNNRDVRETLFRSRTSQL